MDTHEIVAGKRGGPAIPPAPPVRASMLIIAREFGLSSGLSIERYNSSRHSVWTVRDHERRCILKVFRDTVETRQMLLQEHELLQKLRERNYPIGCSFETRTVKQPFVELPDRLLAALYPHVSGRACRRTPADCFAAGRALARFHVTVDQIESPKLQRQHDLELLLNRPLALLCERVRKTAFEATLATLLSGIRKWMAGLPRGVGVYGICHGDAHIDNVVIDETDGATLVDFELTGWGWRAYDLATFVWGTFGEPLGAELWNAMMCGYGSERDISDDEASWIRVFLVVREWWWLGFEAETLGEPRVGSLEEDLGWLIRMADEISVDEILSRLGGSTLGSDPLPANNFDG